MSKEKNVLVIGRHADMLQKIVALLNQQGYRASGAQSNVEALAAFSSQNYQAVVIGGGVDTESRNLFHREFAAIAPSAKIIDAHPSTVLSSLAAVFGGGD